jgi:maltose operon protein
MNSAVRIACAALVLAGMPAVACAAGPRSDAALLAAAQPCCEDPSRFRYAALPADGSVEFTIDRGSPVFEFQSGRSFFHAFRLPALGKAYTLELRSYVEDAKSTRDARVFYPVVAILTDDFLVSRATDLDFLRFELPVFEQATAPAYRLALPLDPANRRERYLVVFTPAQLLQPRALPAPTPDTAAQAARDAWLGASAFGRFRVTLRPTGAEAMEDAPTPDATRSKD